MKKKIWIPLVIVTLLAILVIPIPMGVYKDGGTREYTALAYKIVDWNRLSGDTVYDKTRVYFFPNNFKSIDGLWDYEEDKVDQGVLPDDEAVHSFSATVLEINGSSVLVEPIEGDSEKVGCDKISFGMAGLEDIGVAVGSVVNVTYRGGVMETYPAQIHATSWKLVRN